MFKKFGSLKTKALALVGLSGLAMADGATPVVTIPQSAIDNLNATATSIGQSSASVWIEIAVVVLGIVILKKVFFR